MSDACEQGFEKAKLSMNEATRAGDAGIILLVLVGVILGLGHLMPSKTDIVKTNKIIKVPCPGQPNIFKAARDFDRDFEFSNPTK